MIEIKRGLELPITGNPTQELAEGPEIRQVALVGYDYPGLKPTMEVREGDLVKAGQLVFSDRLSAPPFTASALLASSSITKDLPPLPPYFCIALGDWLAIRN